MNPRAPLFSLLLTLSACGGDDAAPGAAPYGPFAPKCAPGSVPETMPGSVVRALGTGAPTTVLLGPTSLRCTTESADGLLYRCVGPRAGSVAGAPSPWNVGFLLAFRQRQRGTPADQGAYRTIEHGRDFDVRELYLTSAPGVSPAQRFDATGPIGGLDLTIQVHRDHSGLNRAGLPYTQPQMVLEGSACGGAVSGTFRIPLTLDETLPPA